MPVDLAGGPLRRGDDVGDGALLNARMDDQHIGHDGGEEDRPEGLHGVVGQAREEARIGGVGARVEEDRVAIGLGGRHRIGADRAAGAAAVLDDEAAAGQGRELLEEDAADRVGAAAGRIGHDDAHRAGGPGLGAGEAWGRERGKAAGERGAAVDQGRGPSGHGRAPQRMSME